MPPSRYPLAAALFAGCAAGVAPGVDAPGRDADVEAPAPTDSEVGGDSPASHPGDSDRHTDSVVDTGEVPTLEERAEADLVVLSSGSDGDFGEAIEATGDFDGDGRPDLVVVSDGDDNWGRDIGAAYVFFGPSRGSMDPSDADVVLTGEHADSLRGVTAVDDLDGDGGSELVVQLGDSGRLFSSRQLAPGALLAPGDALGEAWSWQEGGRTWDDVDGDGVPEVLVGDEDYSVMDPYTWLCGRLRVLDGADFLVGIHTALVDTTNAHYTDYDELGGTIHLVPDRDGDGLREVVASQSGGDWLVLGSQALLEDGEATVQSIDARWLWPAGSGEGGDDLLALRDGPRLSMVGQDDGDLDASDSVPGLDLYGGNVFAASTVGDIDGDGLPELLLQVYDGVFEGLVRVDSEAIVAGGELDFAEATWGATVAYPDSVAGDADGWAWYGRCDREPYACRVGGFDTTEVGILAEGDEGATIVTKGPYLAADGVGVEWIDVDGNGSLDLVLLRQGTFPGAAVIPGEAVAAGGSHGACDHGCVEAPVNPYVVDDLDGDGGVEVLLDFDEGVERFGPASLAAGFDAEPVASFAGEGLVASFQGLGAGDANGDGIPDPVTSSLVADGAVLLDGFGPSAVLAYLRSDLQHLGDVDGDGLGELSSSAALYAGATLGGGVSYADIVPLYTYSASVLQVATLPADVDGDGLSDVPLALASDCGWLPGVPAGVPTLGDLAVAIPGAVRCEGAWAIPVSAPVWLLVAYGDTTPQLRLWRYTGPGTYTEESARAWISLYQAGVRWVGVDPVDGVGPAALVYTASAEGDGGRLSFYRLP